MCFTEGSSAFGTEYCFYFFGFDGCDKFFRGIEFILPGCMKFYIQGDNGVAGWDAFLFRGDSPAGGLVGHSSTFSDVIYRFIVLYIWGSRSVISPYEVLQNYAFRDSVEALDYNLSEVTGRSQEPYWETFTALAVPHWSYITQSLKTAYRAFCKQM